MYIQNRYYQKFSLANFYSGNYKYKQTRGVVIIIFTYLLQSLEPRAVNGEYVCRITSLCYIIHQQT